MAGSVGGGDDPEFQIAPMIDVLLVMLIFFMTITSTQVLKVDKTIRLPLAPHAAKKDDKRAEAVVNVRWNGDTEKAVFVMDDKVYERADELVPMVKALRIAGEKTIASDQNPNFRVVIRADRNVPAIHVSKAMNACAEAGVADLSFSAMNKD